MSVISQCYTINGEIDESSYPCSFAGESAAQCCHGNDTCMSNGLCMPVADPELITPYFVVGCTDQDWTSDQCLDTCLRDNGGGDGIKDCGGGYYCCYGIEGCTCDDKNALNVFTLPIVRAVATIPPSSEWLDPSPTSPETTTSATSAEITPTADETVTSGTKPAIATDLAEQTAAATQTPEKAESTSSVLTIGLGAGLGVGIAFIAALVGILWFLRVQKRKRNNSEKQHEHAAAVPPYQGYSHYQDAPPYAEVPGSAVTGPSDSTTQLTSPKSGLYGTPTHKTQTAPSELFTPSPTKGPSFPPVELPASVPTQKR